MSMPDLQHTHYLNFSAESDMQHVLPQDAIVTSDPQQWQHIHLKYFRYDAHQIPEHASQQHTIVIQTDIVQTVEQEMTIEGEMRREQLQEGQILVIPAQALNSAQWQQPHGSIVISIEPQFFQQQAQSAQLTHLKLVRQFSRPDPLIYGMGLALRQELSIGQPGGKLYVESASVMLVQHLFRHYSSDRVDKDRLMSGLPAYQVKSIVDYLRAHLAEDISLETLAGLVKLSQSHFTSLFRHSTGLSPYQYLLRLRIDRAKELLLLGNLSIAEVAIVVGFYDQSHLAKQMKRLLGVTPRQLQQQR